MKAESDHSKARGKVLQAIRMFACAAGMLLGATAGATLHHWRLADVLLYDGATATGAFTYDDATDRIVAWNIHLSKGDQYLPFTYMPGDSEAGFYFRIYQWQTVVFSSREAGRPDPFVVGSVQRREFRFTIALPLNAPVSTISIDRVNWGGGIGAQECYSCLFPRYIVAGALERLPEAPPIAEVEAVEFHHAAFDHYFMSADPIEINALDTGYFTGWARTGYSFRVFAMGSYNGAPVRPVCRYYGLPSAGLDSHFYSADPAECFRVNRDFGSEWQIESGNVFQIALPDATTGACPSGTIPVYRVYDNRRDANHRYTTSAVVRAQMEAAGWIREGYGPDATIMCAVAAP